MTNLEFSPAAVAEPFTPLDKSWEIRNGFLNLFYGDPADSLVVLDDPQYQPLSDDLRVMRHIIDVWPGDEPINIGEAGTPYRIANFASWILGLNKKFITSGTLVDRPITLDPSIVNLSQAELCKLDNHTSQWATAAVLLGDPERLDNPAFKLKLTYEAWDEWHDRRAQDLAYLPRKDDTIRQQVITFLRILQGERPDFVPEQAEDWPFAYIFGYSDVEEARSRWPNLLGHESNRMEETPAILELAKVGEPIPSMDHRNIQAIGMWGVVNEVELEFIHPEAVSKSFPRYWPLIDRARHLTA